MTQMINANPEVVADLLSRYNFASYQDLLDAQQELSAGVRLSMEHTAAYNIPIEQKLPPEIERTAAAPYVHPYNIATALVSVCLAGQRLGGQNLALDPSLQIHAGASGWIQVAGAQVPAVAVMVAAPPAPAPAPVPAPAIPLAAAPAPGVGDLASLVDAALGTQPAVNATGAQPAAITTPEQYEAYRQAQGYPPATPTVPAAELAAPQTVPATPLPATPAAPQQAPVQSQGQIVIPLSITAAEADQRFGPGNWVYEVPPTPQQVQQAIQTAVPAAPIDPPPQYATQTVPPVYAPAQVQTQAAGNTQPSRGLPDPSVMAERKTAAGRPQKSPFERPVAPRKSVGAPPFWFAFLRTSAPKLFTDNPASALDPDSTGSGPIQAYALLVTLAQQMLLGADGDVTVAELRHFLREVETGMKALPSGAAIYQIVDELYPEQE